MKYLFLLPLLFAGSARADFVDDLIRGDFPVDVRAAIRRDLTFLAGITGSGQSLRHDTLFGNVSGGDYLLFFTRRIQAIKWAKRNGADGPANAVAFYSTDEPATMFIRDRFRNNNLPQVATIAVLWHEARHSEPQNHFWQHVTCPVPFRDASNRNIVSGLTGLPLQGTPGCDSTSLGAYGVTATMMGNIHKYCTNCTDKVKEDADLMFQDSTRRHLDRRHQDEIKRDLGRS